MPIPSQAHDDETLAALKSGKTVYDAAVLRELRRLCNYAERLVQYYEKVFEETKAPVTKGRKSDA